MSGGAGAFKVFVGLHVIDNASKNLTHFANLAAMAHMNVGKINKQLGIMGGLAAALAGGAIVATMTGLAEKSAQAADKLEQVERRVRALGGMSPAMFASVSQNAWGLAGSNPATSQVQRLEVFRDLHRVFADPTVSKKLLPGSLQFLTAMKALNPNVGENEMYAAFKGAELTALAPKLGHTINPDQFNHKLDILTKIYGGMGVAPSEMFSFLKMARYNRGTLTDRGLFHSAALIQELSGSTAGTTIQAMSRAVLAGKFGNATTGLQYAKEAERLGLLTNITERARHGEPKRFDVRGAGLFAQDPVEWIHRFLGPALLNKGLDINNPNAQQPIISQIARIFGSQIAAGGAYQILSHYGVITKDRQQGEKAQGKGPLATMFANSYSGAFESVGSAMTDTLATLGKVLAPTIVPALQQFASFLRETQKFIQQHPAITRMATGVAFLSGAILMVVGPIVTLTALLGGPTVAAIGIIGGAIVGAVGYLALLTHNIQNAIPGIVTAFRILMGTIMALVAGAIGNIASFASNIPGLRGTMGPIAYGAGAYYKGGLAMADNGWNSLLNRNTSNTNNTQHVTVHAPITVKESPDGKASAFNIKQMMNDIINPKAGYFHTQTPDLAGYRK